MLKSYLPYVNYYVNYDYIAENLCENKDKPEMHCNGKCHLEKTIKEAEAEETKQKNIPTIVKVINFQEIPTKSLKFEFKTVTVSNNITKIIARRYLSPVLDIVSPPPQAV
jgi:hypothetical protein